MAIIDPDGLFEGERLARCSDLAQLYWPRLFIAANGYGRLELSYSSLCSKIFRHFKNPPTEEQLWHVFEELAENYLAIVYEADGVWWAQLVTSDKYLPRYKTTRDEQSPAPPEELVEQVRKGYLEWKRAKSSRHSRFQKFSENFGKFPKISEGEERSGVGVGDGVGVGVGVGVGEERRGDEGSGEGSPLRAPAAAKPSREIASLAAEVVCAHPRSRLRKLRRNEVRPIQQAAVLEAMREEAQAASCSEVEALKRILSAVQSLAEKIPRQQWRFLKDVPEFFRNHDYRVAPETFLSRTERETGDGRNKSNRAEAAVDSVFASTRAALARIPGLDHQAPGRTGSDDG